jgi:integrase
MGGLRKRGEVWWIRYNRNGRRYEESARSSRKADAVRLLQLREGDVAKGVPVTPALHRTTFDEAVQDVINDYKANGKRTVEHVARRWTLHLQPAFGGRRLGAITTPDLRAYITARQKAGAKTATINRELAVVKRAFRLALQAGKTLQMPHVPMMRERNVRTGFFEREQFEAVRRHLPAPLQAVITFAYLTGWRVPSEVSTLQWRQIDWRSETVRLEVGTTKNDEGRTFPFGELPALRTLLLELRDQHDALRKNGIVCPWVFHRDGVPVKTFRKAWAAACKAAGVPGRIPHDFRRTAVRNLVRAGVPERVSMQLTGHKTRSVFDRYDIVNEADLRGAVGKLACLDGTKMGQSVDSSRTGTSGQST